MRGAAGELAEEVVAVSGRTLTRQAERGVAIVASTSRALVEGARGSDDARRAGRDGGDDVEWLRRQLARGLRSLLVAPDEAAERLRTADPTTMARAVLALVGGDEALVPLPSAEEQVRQRFGDLLAPEVEDDRTTLAPALLSITSQLSPDEARILRHLHTVGSAPVVDVESTTLTTRHGPVVAEHLSMLVERSGGDHPRQGPQYVADLLRLGVCGIDDEAPGDHPDLALVEDTAGYRDAVAAVRAAGRRPRRRDRTIRLTPLGARLMQVALGPPVEPADPADGPPPVPRIATDHPLAAAARVTRPVHE